MQKLNPSDYLDFCTRWLSAWTGNRPEQLREFYTEDSYYRDPARPQGLRGAELLPYFTKLLAKNPAWEWKAVEILPTEKGFCLKWKASIPAGPTVVSEEGLDIVEMRGTRISRNEVYFDRAGLMNLSRDR
ncbi:MAG: nuclear transport factor 2 family protein, partial [Bdellovibrionota bacterium]